MLFKKSSLSKAEAFWNWFIANNSKYLFLNEISEDEKEGMMNDFLAQLHKYCDQLYFEIGGHPKDEKVELIITAEGVVKYFEKVEELVDAAPTIPGWVVLKYKQALGPGFNTSYRGKTFDPDKIIFIQLHSEQNPEGIGIQVCYPDYSEEERNVFVNGTYITIDSLIGEKSAVLDVEYLEVIKTPEGIAEEDYPVLSSIGQLIRERKIYKYPVERFDVNEGTSPEGYLTFVTINLGYKGFKYKEEFPWFLKVTLDFQNYNENGHPVEDEARELNSFEDFLEKKIKEESIAHYIGRATLYKKREILYYIQDGKKVKETLTKLLNSSDPIRSLSFEITKDPDWTNVRDVLGG